VDGSETGMVDYGRRGTSGGCHLEEAERKRGQDGQWHGCDRRKGGVRMGDCVDAANAGVDLGGILDGLEIVGDGDDGEQDEDKNGEGDPLGSPGCACLRHKAQPEADDRDGR